jgi:hypothetical protein
MTKHVPTEQAAAEKARQDQRQSQRQVRLARQLRENLKRRKAQMRGRAAQSSGGGDKQGD